jgi:hypothetical protein
MKQKLCVSAFENKKKEADLSDFSDSWRSNIFAFFSDKSDKSVSLL